jgi:hypothetical protein
MVAKCLSLLGMHIYLDDLFFIYFSNIHDTFIWYIYMGVLYLLGCFSVFLVMMNGGGLPQPQELGFYHGNLSFAPSSDRAVPRYPDPSIVWNILSFAPQRQRVFVAKNFITKAYFFAHKGCFVATFLIVISRHKYSSHKYSSDDFSFPTVGHTH